MKVMTSGIQISSPVMKYFFIQQAVSGTRTNHRSRQRGLSLLDESAVAVLVLAGLLPEPPPLKSVAYQPEPLSWKPAALSSRVLACAAGRAGSRNRAVTHLLQMFFLETAALAAIFVNRHLTLRKIKRLSLAHCNICGKRGSATRPSCATCIQPRFGGGASRIQEPSKQRQIACGEIFAEEQGENAGRREIGAERDRDIAPVARKHDQRNADQRAYRGRAESSAAASASRARRRSLRAA